MSEFGDGVLFGVVGVLVSQFVFALIAKAMVGRMLAKMKANPNHRLWREYRKDIEAINATVEEPEP